MTANHRRVIKRLSPPQLHIGFASQGSSTCHGRTPIDIAPGLGIEVPFVGFATDHLIGRFDLGAAAYTDQFLGQCILPFQKRAALGGLIFFWIHKGLRWRDRGEVDRFLGVAGDVIRYNHDRGAQIDHGIILLGRGDTRAVRRKVHEWGQVDDDHLFDMDRFKRWMLAQLPTGLSNHQRRMAPAQPRVIEGNSSRRTG